MQSKILRGALSPLALAAGMGAALAGAGPAAALDAAGCAALAGVSLPAKTFAIPSGAATIDTAQMKDPAPESTDDKGARVPATPSYCQLNGRIAAVGQAPDIGFQINLPADWNGKAVQYGGGGYNGTLITGLAPLRDARPDTPIPLAQGYVTAGTDSGHLTKDLPEMMAFALNPEALENFAHASYKKLHDLTVAVTQRAYGKEPARHYYFGGSEGGREGLTMAQRYPADFDGIVSAVPVINWVGLQSTGTRNGNLQRKDGAWLTPEAVKVLGRAALEQCDKLDGLADGVVSNTEDCRKTFSLDAYVCKDGTTADCLTPAQAEVARALREPTELGLTVQNGVTSYPGLPIGGETQENGFGYWTSGTEPPSVPTTPDQARTWLYGNGGIRYFVAQDASFDVSGYSAAALADGAQRISALMDSTDPDLSAFADGGGKLILVENMADQGQSPYAGITYYQSVVDRLGQDNVDGFLHFYLKAGANHSGKIFDAQGKPLPAQVDLLERLDAWVDGGKVPDAALVMSAHDAAPPYAQTATRPLCSYPGYPHLTGADPADAASFECRTPAAP